MNFASIGLGLAPPGFPDLCDLSISLMETFATSSLHRFSPISSIDSPASEAGSGKPEMLFLGLYCSDSVRSFPSSATR
ncbi:hypothetical protein DPMN_100190 [Dreissena polymorpha]|uniref:Uncharacterized protein n=1 Tax=Dreissena polymorpha TaxID=45954 RepID=A0A9D4R8X1_DREPO|nr:hypothetical protein DPMN_100190 [Dreissena polymorpha]